MKREMNFDEWMSYGIKNGWCGPPVCSTHDGVPMSAEEEDTFMEGDDPCVHIIRMYSNLEEKALVEEAHSPSRWRDHYTKVPKGGIKNEGD